jgi:hypothetical protein
VACSLTASILCPRFSTAELCHCGAIVLSSLEFVGLRVDIRMFVVREEAW